MAVITVSRQHGSRGEEVSRRVAEALSYSYFDKEILADVARTAHTTEDQITPYDEKDEHGLRYFLKNLSVPSFLRHLELLDAYYPESVAKEMLGDSAKQEGILDADHVASLFHFVIKRLWERDNVVIVGRGSQRILDAMPNTFHVRFIAPVDDRCKQIMRQEGIAYPEALRWIKVIDSQRARYLKHHYDTDWDDATCYHVVINTSLMHIEQAVKTIASAIGCETNHVVDTEQKK